MIRLEAVTEQNWREAAALTVRKEQRAFLDTPLGILARGYVYRDCNARVFAIANESALVGLALVRNLDEEPACYDLQQFLVDERAQNQGIGTQALQLLVSTLREERTYDRVEVCVHRENAAALRLFQKAGFRDTGYIDAAAPDCLNLTVDFHQRGTQALTQADACARLPRGDAQPRFAPLTRINGRNQQMLT